MIDEPFLCHGEFEVRAHVRVCSSTSIVTGLSHSDTRTSGAKRIFPL